MAKRSHIGIAAQLLPAQEQQLLCNCCGQPHYPDKAWRDRLEAVIRGAEKYAICPLCTQIVPKQTFEQESYRRRCRREVQRLKLLHEEDVRKQELKKQT